MARAGERAPGNGRRGTGDGRAPCDMATTPMLRLVSLPFARASGRSIRRARGVTGGGRSAHSWTRVDARRGQDTDFGRAEKICQTPVHRRAQPAREHRWISTSRADRAARATGRLSRGPAGSPASNPRRRFVARTADTGNTLGRCRARSPGAVAAALSTSRAFGRSGSSRRSRAATGSGTGPCSGASSTR